jgi:hypothetical protein
MDPRASVFAVVTYGLTTDIDKGGMAAMGITLGWFTPAAGHWYTGRVGTYSFLARMGGVVFFMTGVSELSDAKKCARGIEVTDGCDGVSRGVGRAAIGLGRVALRGLARLRLHLVASRSARLQLAPQD